MVHSYKRNNSYKRHRVLNIPECYRRFMYLHDIHNEMKNECGDAQEREEVIDPLRAPLPEGSNDWERGFMKSMHKAKKYNWTLSQKQIETLERIRGQEEDEMDFEVEECYQCDEYGTCDDCHEKRIEEDYGHMNAAQRERWNAFANDVLNDRDLMSGAYGRVPIYRGACPKSYDSRGFSTGGWSQ